MAAKGIYWTPPPLPTLYLLNNTTSSYCVYLLNTTSSYCIYLLNNTTCPQKCWCLAYIALIRSSLEYGATVWDPYLKQDVDRLERVQCQAARFIKRDYRTRETGCMGHMLQELNLPPLQERRKQQRLTTLYKTVKGHIPAMPPESFPMPADRNRRRIRPATCKDCDSDNTIPTLQSSLSGTEGCHKPVLGVCTIPRHEIQNSCGFKIPDSKTEQYKNSFFVRTVADWNKLEDMVVTANSVTAFSSAVGRVLQGAASQSHTEAVRTKMCFSQFLNGVKWQTVQTIPFNYKFYLHCALPAPLQIQTTSSCCIYLLNNNTSSYCIYWTTTPLPAVFIYWTKPPLPILYLFTEQHHLFLLYLFTDSLNNTTS